MTDTKPVDKSLRSAWPPGTKFGAAAQTHEAQPNRGQVSPAPARGKKRPTQRKASK